MAATTTTKVLISGGSRGLGLHLASHLLANGHAVATFARSETAAVIALHDAYPDTFRFAAADARDLPTITAFAKAFAKEFGRLDALINNAAIGQDSLLAQTRPAAIQDLLAINVEAPILLTRHVIRTMLLQTGTHRIINISSICGSRGYPGLTVYAATKGAMDAFTRALAREVGDRGILVNSIAPGFFESDMSSVLLPEQLATIRRRTPTGVMSTEAHITHLVDLLLFTDHNITGQTLTVDGGVSC